MKVPWYWCLSIILLIFLAVVLAATQTTLWYLVFGGFPAPLFWLVILVYVAVTRPLWEATLMAYLLSMVNASFTAFPFAAFLVLVLALTLLMMQIRERMYWGGSLYFSMMVGIASLASPILFWITSRWFDKNPVVIPNIFEWLISIMLTVLVSFPIYHLCGWIDRIALNDSGSEGRIGPK